MNRMGYILAVAGWWAALALYGQAGQVWQAQPRAPLAGATIYALANQQGVVSDAEGRFVLALTRFPDTLVVSYLGYESRRLRVEGPAVQLEVTLWPETLALPDVTVSAFRQPRRLSADFQTVVDYVLLPDRQWLAVVHYQRAPHYRLQLGDFEGRVWHELPLPDRQPPEGLFVACLGGVYLLYPAYFREVRRVLPDSLALGDAEGISVYRQALKPCVLADEAHFYTAYHRYRQQVLQFFVSARHSSAVAEPLVTVYHEEVLRRVDDEARFVQNKASTLEGVDNQLQRTLHMVYQEGLFAEQVVFQPVVAQLFRQQEALLLFDFANHSIRWLGSGQEVPFPVFVRQPGQARVIQDGVSQKLYVLLPAGAQATVCYEIDPRTGALAERAYIPEVYLKNPQIADGWLFYLHRGITFEERWQELYKVQIMDN